MDSSKRGYIALALILVTGAFLFIHSKFSTWKENDEKLTDVSGKLSPGQRQEEISGLLEAYRREVPARLEISDDKRSWDLYNPSEWGAQERILYLEFDTKGALVHRRLRTGDSEAIAPKGAPPDF